MEQKLRFGLDSMTNINKIKIIHEAKFYSNHIYQLNVTSINFVDAFNTILPFLLRIQKRVLSKS